ncbi:MAG: hypothetical protein PUD59_03725 [bacterium]|nr:hypothetical protein [bacterium]
MNKKAFTVVELIITFVIVMTISIGLFKVVDSYREKQIKESSKKEVANYRDEILRVIEDDVVKGIDEIKKVDINGDNKCNGYDQGMEIEFKNGDSKFLCILSNSNGASFAKVIYGDREFIAPNKFIKISNDIINDYSDIFENQIMTEKYEEVSTRRIYKINISIIHEELDERFIINIVQPKTESIKVKYKICDGQSAIPLDSKNIGDDVTICGETFYIIDKDTENNTVSLLTKYNLTTDDINNVKQLDSFNGTGWDHYKEFSNNKYWTTNNSAGIAMMKREYMKYSYGNGYYIYSNQKYIDSNGNAVYLNSAAVYVNSYVEFLKSNGINVNFGRLPSVSEYDELKKNYNSPSWLCSSNGSPGSFWFGNNAGNGINTMQLIYNCYNGSLSSNTVYSAPRGIRPVIIVPEKYWMN